MMQWTPFFNAQPGGAVGRPWPAEPVSPRGYWLSLGGISIRPGLSFDDHLFSTNQKQQN